MTDDLSDDDLPEDDTGDEDEEEGSGGDDHAALTLETPESAAAIAAAMAGNKDGKKIGKKGKAGAKGVGVALDDAALGLDEGAEDDEPEAEEEEGASYQSSIDRDEITDPDPEDRIDPLAALLGGQDKPWENEKLSLAERMVLQEGYLRNDPNAPGEEELDANGAKKGPRVAAGVVAGVVGGVVGGVVAGAAIGAVAAGKAAAKGVADTPDGSTVAGVSRGPAHKAEDTATTTARETRQQQEARNKQAAQSTTGLAAAPASPVIREQEVRERQNREAERRETDTRLQAEQRRTEEARIRAEAAAQQKSGPDMAEILLHQQIANNVSARAMAAESGGPVDPDMVLRSALHRVYEALGLNQLIAGMGNDRLDGWARQTEGLRENARDLTEPQSTAPAPPTPELEQQRNMSINIGLGGP